MTDVISSPAGPPTDESVDGFLDGALDGPGAEGPDLDLGSDERVLRRDDSSAVLRLSEAEAAVLAGDPDDPPTGDAADQRMKIGRASCRERVLRLV